jgi:stage V sporulation protein G
MDFKVNVKKLEDKGNLKAMVSVTFEDSFVVTGLKIMNSNKGDLFVSMPNYKLANGDYKDSAFPITKEFREELFTAILDEYNKGDAYEDPFATVVDDGELPF